MPRILVVDDEERYCKILGMMLRHADYEVTTTSSGSEAMRLLEEEEVDVIISDLFMSPVGGMDLLRHRNSVAPDVPFVILTAFGTIPSAVDMIRHGAFDYLTKPFQEEALLTAVRNALKVRALAEENRSLKVLLKESLGEPQFVGKSFQVTALLDKVRTVARTDLTVMILGETGTGKDLIARLVHGQSAVKDGPFVKVNCAAIPATLLESELFGYEKGAFSGAVSRQKGKFHLAQGGTLFLDEIGELDVGLQAKTLQAIEEKCFYPLGSSRMAEVNCRIVAASNRPLRELAEQGRFREDLLHRLMAFPVHIPPLRERREDIQLLAEHYLREFCSKMGSSRKTLHSRALEFLQAYHWPGNVRELMNVLRSAVLVGRAPVILLEDFSWHPGIFEDHEAEDSASAVPDSSSIPTLAQAERDLIERALRVSAGNKSRAARILGISRSHLRYRMMLHDL